MRAPSAALRSRDGTTSRSEKAVNVLRIVDWPFAEVAAVVMGGEHGANFRKQGVIAGARAIEVIRASGGVLRERCMKDIRDPPPALRRYGVPL